jgi:hypothetical protein
MRRGFRRWWPLIKLAVGILIIVFIGRQFVRDLRRPELELRPLHFGWLALSGGLYLIGLGFSGLYWHRLLAGLGHHPPLRASLWAYYLGHFGKHLPGKAWALILRAGLIHSHNIRLAVGVVTSIYEVLVTMAAGALLAAILFALLGTDTGSSLDLLQLLRVLWQQPDDAALSRTDAVVLALCLVAATALPLQPVLFNRLTHRFIHHATDHPQPPRFRFVWFLEGLGLTMIGWLFLGLSLAAALQGIAPGPYATLPTLGRLTAAMSFSYVAGFVVIVTPNGLGVREFFLTLLLVPELVALLGVGTVEARGIAVLSVIVLRLVWTVAELLLGAVLYWQKPRHPGINKKDEASGDR